MDKQILTKNDVSKVIGEIYKITNTTNGKYYIGQTRSHRLNHNKYRPFGYLGRFKDHINEANSNKKNQSRYLNSAILKYGSDCFTCDLIHTCPVSELNIQEQQFILKYNSKYPNGYNLTNGGRGFTDISGQFIWENTTVPKEKSVPLPKSDYTKQLISERLKSALHSAEKREKMMKLTQNQHLTKKYEMFKAVNIDDEKIDTYIHVIKNNTNDTEYVRLIIDKVKTTFVGKYEPIDTLLIRARQFIFDLKKWQHCQIAGNPLEPSLPLTFGNNCEELG
jgi:hypothetical protein